MESTRGKPAALWQGYTGRTNVQVLPSRNWYFVVLVVRVEHRAARPVSCAHANGRPSGLYIARHDVPYASDSESRNSKGYGYHPGWSRGVRIGSAQDGVVTAFIPDLQPDQESKDTTGGGASQRPAAGMYSGPASNLEKSSISRLNQEKSNKHDT